MSALEIEVENLRDRVNALEQKYREQRTQILLMNDLINNLLNELTEKGIL